MNEEWYVAYLEEMRSVYVGGFSFRSVVVLRAWFRWVRSGGKFSKRLAVTRHTLPIDWGDAR